MLFPFYTKLTPPFPLPIACTNFKDAPTGTTPLCWQPSRFSVPSPFPKTLFVLSRGWVQRPPLECLPRVAVRLGSEKSEHFCPWIWLYTAQSRKSLFHFNYSSLLSLQPPPPLPLSPLFASCPTPLRTRTFQSAFVRFWPSSSTFLALLFSLPASQVVYCGPAYESQSYCKGFGATFSPSALRTFSLVDSIRLTFCFVGHFRKPTKNSHSQGVPLPFPPIPNIASILIPPMRPCGIRCRPSSFTLGP